MDSRLHQTLAIAGTAGDVIVPQATSGDTGITSAVIDTLGYNSLVIVMNWAAATGGTVSVTPSLVEGDSTSPVTAVTLETAIGAQSCAANGSKLYFINLDGMNRYIKIALAVVHGTSGTCNISVAALLGSANVDPAGGTATHVYKKST